MASTVFISFQDSHEDLRDFVKRIEMRLEYPVHFGFETLYGIVSTPRIYIDRGDNKYPVASQVYTTSLYKGDLRVGQAKYDRIMQYEAIPYLEREFKDFEETSGYKKLIAALKAIDRQKAADLVENIPNFVTPIIPYEVLPVKEEN
jgi:hypothetical protein